jgi:hypothetical protein
MPAPRRSLILKLKARIEELDHYREGPDSEAQGSES